jgi:hypothetical protein
MDGTVIVYTVVIAITSAALGFLIGLALGAGELSRARRQVRDLQAEQEAAWAHWSAAMEGQTYEQQ